MSSSTQLTQSEQIDIDIWLEEFLSGLLERTGLDAWVSQMDIDENANTYTVQVDGDDKSRIIGKEGQMLNALQHLVVAAAANQSIHHVKFVIDVDGYRDRRDDKLEKEATALAREVIESGKPLEMEPMCSRDRRLVHMIVSGIDGVSTQSFGQGRDRYIRLIPAG